jgi:hypothetical protein
LVGFTLFAAFGFTSEVISLIFWGRGQLILAGWIYAAYATFQTIGLILLTLSGADINIFAKRNKTPAFAFVFLYLIYTAFWALLLEPPTSNVFWIMALPFAYLLSRHQSVFDMQPTYPRFSELFALSLLLFNAANFLLIPIGIVVHPQHPVWPQYALACYVFASVVGMVVYYYHQLRTYQNLTIALYAAIYAYLLGYGGGDFLQRVLDHYVYQISNPFYAWLFGPVHIREWAPNAVIGPDPYTYRLPSFTLNAWNPTTSANGLCDLLPASYLPNTAY